MLFFSLGRLFGDRFDLLAQLDIQFGLLIKFILEGLKLALCLGLILPLLSIDVVFGLAELIFQLCDFLVILMGLTTQHLVLICEGHKLAVYIGHPFFCVS